jgi:hypothetical protein
MVALHGGEIEYVPIKDVAGKIRKVELKSSLIRTALSLGTSMGVDMEQILNNEPEAVI